jgi:surface protein
MCFQPKDRGELKAVVGRWIAAATKADPAYRAALIEEYGHINCWDTSSVTDMSWMFVSPIGDDDCADDDFAAFNDDISKVLYMDDMFYYATAFNGNLSNWDTSKVTNMYGMFRRAKAFNQKLCWDVGSVNNRWAFNEMFVGSQGSLDDARCQPKRTKPTTRPKQ